MRAAPVLIAVVLLAGCGKGNDDVGGVSPEEDRLLNEAAASQDANLTIQPIGNATDAPEGNAQ